MLLQNAEIYTNKINAPADIADAILIQRTQWVLREIIHSGRWDTDQGRKIFPEGKIRLPQIAQIYTDKNKSVFLCFSGKDEYPKSLL
jgi:hypothetical protein